MRVRIAAGIFSGVSGGVALAVPGAGVPLSISAAVTKPLLCFLRLTSFVVLALPHWVTDTFNAGRHRMISVADILFVTASAIMVLIERKRLFVQFENHSADRRDIPPATTIE